MKTSHLHRVLSVAADVTEGSTPLDVSCLTHVVFVDPAARTCIAEPGVTFDRLAEATLPLGLVPPPELGGMTVGRAFAHVSPFRAACIELELVTDLGDVVRCSREHDRKLFERVRASRGTCGVVTAITFELHAVARRARRVA